MSYYTYLYLDPRKSGAFSYEIVHVNFQPFYVGKGQNQRCFDHLKETEEKTDNIFKIRKIQSIRAAGLEPIITKVLHSDNEKEVYDLEANLIRHWGREGKDENGILTNLEIDNRPPNHTGKPKSDEQKKKMREAYWRRVTQPGYVHPCKGKKLSDEEKEMARQANIGRKHTDEQRRKNSEAKKSLLKDPTNHPMYGKHHSDTAKQAISDSKRGSTLSIQQIADLSARWLIIPPIGAAFEIDNLAQWCRDNNMNQGNMHSTSIHLNRKCKGYKCKKLEPVS